ncbi:filamentous hemagglutinin outer membrane protein [Caballeronia sordidicola]|uniref:Filamentous hemagglutinin outer membrane protein n=1 Tax=Caballeronia sordidicola TaxID=196367 RepID=A0A158HAT9_CABSO|nr:hemagglutinin repeat-containing protein [Caballeronia sordidicola]SAL41121.1 filamentous hemagglutinin outer membrane protein [Caballeronia sordidicola]
MNKNNYRLVFSRLRNMLVAVEETATATGKEAGQTSGQTSPRSKKSQGMIFTLRQIAFAALALLGALPSWSNAQIVSGGANAPGVINTQNGLPQVNINRPSGAGVSMNTYGQFDVQKNGAILNNSPTIVQTQQAGMINGNPNFGPGQSARVIVNQVNSNAASQINGRVEVAGQRAEVVIANGSGISVNGGGFINTSRAILTTGTPNFAADGALSGFNVSRGTISVQGAGLNAADIDQVDLIARAVQANAAVYAKNLNVVTGANSVSHDTLNATPIAGDGPAPGVSIDVSNLGGMYANRIVLVGTENGVGVSNKGVLATQAGDLTLTTQGKLVLTGQTNASGNLALSARDGIDNSGTTYAQQNVTASTLGTLANSGVVAAQQNTTLNAGSIASTGTLGAGVNNDGTIANAGDLVVSAAGALTATGQTEGGGNTSISGASINLAGSNTSANGTLALAASGGDLNASGATTTAGGALVANAAGTLVNDSGRMSGASVQVAAANVSNRSGQLVSGSTLDATAASDLSNQGGTLQSAGALALNAASLDNTAGRIVSLNNDGLDITATGVLNNGAGGEIGANGALSVSASTLANQGKLTAAGDAWVRAQTIDNHGGTIIAGGVLDVASGGALNNQGGTFSSAATTVSAASIDNTNGDIEGDALAVSASGDLVNRGGTLTQFGAADQTIQAGGTLDNTGGTIASNAANLRIDGQAVTNDKGNIQHAGTGTLALNSAGSISNVAGNVVTNGALAAHAAGGLNNAQGTIQASRRADISAASLGNTAGRIVSLNNDGLTVTTTGALNNGTGGTIGTNGALSVTASTLANQGQFTAAGDAWVRSQSIDNHAGTITAGGALTAVSAGALNNQNGTLSGSATSISASSIDNTSGHIEGDVLSVAAAGNIINRGGKLTQYGTTDQTIQAGGTLDNTGGTLASNANNLSVSGQTVTNDKGNIQHAGTGTLSLNSTGAVSNVAGSVVTNGALVAHAAGGLNNAQGAIQASRRADINAASLDNTGGRIVSLNSDGLNIATTGALNNGAGGTIGTNGALDISAGTLSNQGTLTAAGDASVHAQSLDNHAGSITTGGALDVLSTGTLNNRNGTLSGSTTTVSAASIDNTHGDIDGDALSVSASGDLVNLGGTLTQYGSTDQQISVGGALDNTSGTIATNASNLGISAQSISNDHGTVQHAGTGTLAVTTPGAVSNASGSVLSNGALAIQSGGAVDNQRGAMQAAHRATVSSTSLGNAGGRIVSLNGDGLNITATGALLNGESGTIGTNGALNVTAAALSNQGTLTAADDAWVSAQSIDNHTGAITAGGALDVMSDGALNNQGGMLSGAATTVSATSIDNSHGDINGDALNVTTSGDLVNDDGALTQYGTADQSIQAGGTFDNTNGLIATNANALNVSAQSITNDHGTIQHAGAGTLSVSSTGALSNIGGSAQTNGALALTSASLDNTSGTLLAMQAAQINAASGIVNRDGSLYGGKALAISTQGDIDNTRGSVQTSGDLSVDAGGAITNTQGTISANGTHGMTTVTAAHIDNAGGKLTNAGEGATTITASGITNTGGTLGGNGDVTVNAETLENDAGANLVAGGAADLNIAQRVNNVGGTLFGGTALNLNQMSAAVMNDGGAILGGMDIALNVASLSNAGGAIRANRDVSAAGSVSGNGDMIAGRNLALAVVGDYTNDAGNNLHADGDMAVSATGTLTNSGTLAANGALTATGANVVNTADGDINSSSTTVIAANAMTNAGRIEGDTVTTKSATLANTGAIIGNDVTVNTTDITNTGAAAVIAGANSVHLYASDSVTNADNALIYSLGNLEIARDGTRDASGILANQTGTLTNSAATIEAEGDIDIAARTVNNVRTGVVTEAGTPQDAGTTTLTIWTAGLPAGNMGHYYSLLYPEWRWGDGAIGTGVIGHLMHPITVKVQKDQVTNLDSNAQTFSLATPLTDTYQLIALTGDVETRTITNNPVQYYQSLTDNGNGTYSITFWPDFDPNKNIRPDQLRINEALGEDNHDYVEMKHTTQSSTTTDQLLSAGNAATIQAQGAIRINADTGSINNDSSTMAAGGDLVRRAAGGSVNDTGTVLQQTTIDTAMSDWYWHQKTGGDSDYKIDVPDAISQSTTTVNALPAIATSNQTVQTDAQSISINSVNRQGQTVNGSGVTGGSADGTQLGGITGQSASTGVSGTATDSVSSQSASTGVSGKQTDSVSGQGAQSATVSGAQATSATGQSSNPQTVGGASGGIPNLKLPVSGLYTYNTAPDATYLIVTDPRFTQYSSFISSDYMLGQLGLDPSKTEKRLGDGMYEQTLIRNQVTQLTGRTFLTGYASNLDEYTALMNSGVTYAKEFGLQPGLALTPAQMQQLTTDMVWLVSQDVTLPDGTHQTVLVPQVYLAQSSTVDLTHSGALVAGNAVNLNATGDVNNSGHVTSNLATTIIGNNVVNSGVIGSGGMTAVVAVQDVRNTSGRIGGGDVIVQVGRDVINETQTYGVSKDFGANSLVGRVTGTGIDAIGTISATGNAAVIAGRDVNVNGALIQTGGDAAIAATRDLNLGTAALVATRDVHTTDALNGSYDAVTRNLGSAIVAGGSLATISGRDTTLTGATVSAHGDATLIAGGNLLVTAAKDTSIHNEQSMGGKQAQHISSSYDEAVQGSSVSAGGNVALAAGQNGSGNLAVLGSTVAADTGGVRLVSTGDMTLGSVSETHDVQSWEHNQHSGFLSKETVNDAANSHQVIAAGSTVSGDTVMAAAGHDMTISGSTVAATHDVALAAGNNLTINTTQDTSESSTFHEEKKSGLGALSGGGMSYGNSEQKDAARDSSVTNNASLVGSTNGSVSLAAGNDLHVTGSDLIAAKDITGSGANVTIDAATGATHHDETHERKQSGFTAGLAGGVGDALNNAVSQSEGVSRDSGSGDSRAAALHSIAAASDAYTVGSAAVGAAKGKGMPDIGVQVSFGSGKSRSAYSEDQTLNSGSTVQAGGTAAFVATGGSAPGSGNLTIAGSNVSANDVVLAANNQVNIVNTTDTDSTRSSNSSRSASVGLSATTGGGAGISASMQNAHGDANSDAAIQNASHVTGANSVTIVSGGDTNITGSQVNGRQITADVGGDLNMRSVQDTTTSAAHQSSAGGGIGINQHGGGASFSAQNGHGDANYAGVNEQAGIHAGEGGFDINVKGNTDLKGAVIASDATPDKNSLTTGTLSFSDIQNESHYSAASNGVSAGIAMGFSGKTVGPASGTNGGGISPMLPQDANGDESATTRSAVSAGTITITDGAHQTQDVASLSRDTTNANGAVSKTPDVNALLDKQADMMNAAQAAGQAVAQRIGDYADAQAKATGDPEWREGGDKRAAMQAAGAAVVAGLGGGVGSAAGGAAGAAVGSKMGDALNSLSDSIAASSPTGNADIDKTLGNIVANVVATGAGAVGGGAGAFSSYDVDRFNRQLHPDEYAMAKKNAPIVAKALGISVQEAEGRIVAEILRNSDQQTAAASGGKHDYEVRSIVGCQNLNCDGYKTDPNFANHDYNSQYITSNQSAYNEGKNQIGIGQTYNDLVKANMKNDPFGATLAGVGMIGLGVAAGGGLATAATMATGSTISLAANGGVQAAGGQPFEWTSFAFAGVTGAVSSGMGFGPALLVNVGGALAGSAATGQNPNASMAGATAGTAIGYPIGAKLEGSLNSVLNPWYRQEWKDVGMGISASVPKNAVPSWFGGFGGGVVQEKIGGATQNKFEGKK